MTTWELIEESLRIEGIHRPARMDEIDMYKAFMRLDHITVGDLVGFVECYQPDAVIRTRQGLDVRVGGHIPVPGGPAVGLALDALFERINRADHRAAWRLHAEYEILHPFTDCNGHSGRMIWYWMMRHRPYDLEIGFLHSYYYQTLAAAGEFLKREEYQGIDEIGGQ